MRASGRVRRPGQWGIAAPRCSGASNEDQANPVRQSLLETPFSHSVLGERSPL
ncbi:hypothetical protein [Nonomuraea sp. GTA35]|uniref:hypothetical protein n=1 Tax=Nonomuraea sp. GTA35 TaxID=1676746 RepID=UPI0035C1E246